ncbi:hypothetical protein [Sulfodiicoccus acidiphilus]|nr:hypothetical protein [Sulfodiicoccus acidiphilus]
MQSLGVLDTRTYTSTKVLDVCRGEVGNTDVGPALRLAATFGGKAVILSDFVNTVATGVTTVDLGALRGRAYLVVLEPVVLWKPNYGEVAGILSRSGLDCGEVKSGRALTECLNNGGVKARYLEYSTRDKSIPDLSREIAEFVLS